MKKCFTSLLSQTSEALADPDPSCTVAVSGHNVLGAPAKVLQLTVHRCSDNPWHEPGTFSLVTCNCSHWFGGSGLLCISALYDRYWTVLNLPNFPTGDVKAAHSASRRGYLSLKWQQRQALKSLFTMAMITYLKVTDKGKKEFKEE